MKLNSQMFMIKSYHERLHITPVLWSQFWSPQLIMGISGVFRGTLIAYFGATDVRRLIPMGLAVSERDRFEWEFYISQSNDSAVPLRYSVPFIQLTDWRIKYTRYECWKQPQDKKIKGEYEDSASRWSTNKAESGNREWDSGTHAGIYERCKTFSGKACEMSQSALTRSCQFPCDIASTGIS